MLTIRGWFVVTSFVGVAIVTIGGTGIELGWRPRFPLGVAICIGVALTTLALICASDEVGKPVWKPKPKRESHKPEVF